MLLHSQSSSFCRLTAASRSVATEFHHAIGVVTLNSPLEQVFSPLGAVVVVPRFLAMPCQLDHGNGIVVDGVGVQVPTTTTARIQPLTRKSSLTPGWVAQVSRGVFPP